jgi:hypothetical protein
MRLQTTAILFALLLGAPAAALAQIDQTAWGLTGGFSPQWKVPATIGGVFDSHDIDVSGRELRVGVVRGTTFGGEWGISLVHKRPRRDAAVSVEASDGEARFVTEDAELLGVEAHRFFPFARVGKRVQVGLNLAGGVAQIRGFVRGQYQPFDAQAQSFSALVPARDIFEYAGRTVDWLPIAKVELGVATMLGDRAKVRVSGGLNLPGFQVVNVTFSYLLGQDR